MNFNLDFFPPVIDCKRRCYDPRIQNILELMVQRDPSKRAHITTICNNAFLKTSPYYIELMKEDMSNI